MTIRRSSAYLVLAAAVTLAVGGCGHADRTDRAAGRPVPASSGGPTAGPTGVPVTPAATSGPATPAAPAPTTAAPRSGAGGGGAPAPTTTGPTRLAARQTTDSDPACRPQVLQEATAAAVGGQTVTGVEVLACRNGFARLFAIAAGSTEISGGNQVFLRLENRLWQVVGRTSAATDCGDPALTAEVKAVCAGLA